MPEWIDFKALRAALPFQKVLEAYGVTVKANAAGQHTGLCPLPTHPVINAKRSPSFSASLPRGIWRCFGCGASGNTLDFAVRMERLDPQRPDDVRAVAVKLADRFRITAAVAGRSETAEQRPPRPTVSRLPAAREPHCATNVLVNAPLDFELKNLDPGHPYLRKRGFAAKTVEHFGLGYCARGMLAERIAIPLRDAEGRLVGYAGRLVDDGTASEERPKYLFPSRREREGKTLEFRKSLLLYNANSIAVPADDLVLVEGFASAWWLWQHGYRNVVALMGSSCSEDQAAQVLRLTSPRARIWILADGDEAGERCGRETLLTLGRERFCRLIELKPEAQPTDLDSSQLKRIFERR